MTKSVGARKVEFGQKGGEKREKEGQLRYFLEPSCNDSVSQGDTEIQGGGGEK